MGLNDEGLSVRRSETSDDAGLADLFNRAHAHLAGTVVRSAEDIAIAKGDAPSDIGGRRLSRCTADPQTELTTRGS